MTPKERDDHDDAVREVQRSLGFCALFITIPLMLLLIGVAVFFVSILVMGIMGH